MKLVGDFRSMNPVFQGCYHNSFLYTDINLGQLRWCGIHFPPYQNEIPAPLAPSYLQSKQPKAMKSSPPWATTPNPAVESPKAKCSGSKGGHHCSSGHSSNTSTPKCPDSTSAKKPSSSKEPALNEQEKSPMSQALTSMAVLPPHPLSQLDTNRKESTQKTPAHSTPHFPSAPACLMASAVQWDPKAM